MEKKGIDRIDHFFSLLPRQEDDVDYLLPCVMTVFRKCLKTIDRLLLYALPERIFRVEQ